METGLSIDFCLPTTVFIGTAQVCVLLSSLPQCGIATESWIILHMPSYMVTCH